MHRRKTRNIQLTTQFYREEKRRDTPFLKTSTSIMYLRNNLSAIIAHYSGFPSQNKSSPISVPVYKNESIKNIKDTEEGSKLLLALFDRKDSIIGLVDDLEKLTELPVDNIVVFTPDQESRVSAPNRTVSFAYVGNKFFIVADDNSRGRALKLL